LSIRLGAYAAALCTAFTIVPAVAQAQDSAAAAATGGDDEIMVTARKREERAIDVPIAITAVSGAALERRGAANLADFLQEAPGVGVYDGGSALGMKITIRGISTSLGANENGFYLDDLPFTGVTVPISPDVRAWDLDRVEILRGPQGTLFGEGSMGGTVRILTKGAEPTAGPRARSTRRSSPACWRCAWRARTNATRAGWTTAAPARPTSTTRPTTPFAPKCASIPPIDCRSPAATG
jgi:outer membrane receptor protein involved in Fe transport